MFKIKISMDNEPVFRAKAEKIEDFDDIFKTLRKKFGGKKHGQL